MEYNLDGMQKNTRIFLRNWPTWIGYLALLWSLGYGVLHLVILLRGEGYPFTDTSPNGLFLSLITYLSPQLAGYLFVGLTALGIVILLAMQKPWGRIIPRWFILSFAWTFAISIVFGILDFSLVMCFAYAFLFKFDFNWNVVNQLLCILGGLLWAFAALAYQRKTQDACAYCGRKENGKSLLLVRWSKGLTYLAAFLALPYAFSRFAFALRIPIGVDPNFFQEFDKLNHMATITELVFGTLCVAGGLLTLGLIQKWGEMFPRWFPFIGGKRVPILLAVIPASLIAIIVTAAGVVFTPGFLLVTLGLIHENGSLTRQIWGAIGPLTLWIPWGVAIGFACIAYYYRRREKCSYCEKQ